MEMEEKMKKERKGKDKSEEASSSEEITEQTTEANTEKPIWNRFQLKTDLMDSLKLCSKLNIIFISCCYLFMFWFFRKCGC